MQTVRLLITLLLGGFALMQTAGVSPAAAADSQWRVRYWNNRELDGDPVKKGYEDTIDHDWGDGSPGSEVNSDDFSARWTREVYFNAGTYRFTATMDDGMEVWIDDSLVINAWEDSQVRTEAVDLYMTSGEHALKVNYYEAGGSAVAKFGWTPVAGPPAGSASLWQGLYFNNMTLTGPPVFVRADDAIDFNWKMGSPWPTVNNEHFSISWTRSTPAEAGTYQYDVLTDDGVRLWVNGVLLIDQWHVNQARNYQAAAFHPGGAMDLRLDYFENEGAALITLKMEKDLSSTSQTAVQPAQTALPAGNRAVVVNASWLNVRATPEGGDNVIAAAAGGEVVSLLGRNGGWIKVRLSNAAVGWVGSSYLASNVDFATLPVLNS